LQALCFLNIETKRRCKSAEENGEKKKYKKLKRKYAEIQTELPHDIKISRLLIAIRLWLLRL
jgi:hypothetical protein